jgi:hypothetical protein
MHSKSKYHLLLQHDICYAKQKQKADLPIADATANHRYAYPDRLPQGPGLLTQSTSLQPSQCPKPKFVDGNTMRENFWGKRRPDNYDRPDRDPLRLTRLEADRFSACISDLPFLM